MNNNPGAKVIGDLGEDLVLSIVGGVKSINEFDTYKDLTDSDGRSVEVKTQMCFKPASLNYQVFSISADPRKITNLIKCMLVDRLIFVEYYADSDRVVVHEVVDRRDCKVYYCSHGAKLGWQKSKMKILYDEKNTEFAVKCRSNSHSKILKFY